MSTSSTIFTAVAILIVANLIICINTDTNFSSNSPIAEENVEPLPKNFSPLLREILSPDIFTQTDPFNYLRQKVMKLNYRTMENLDSNLCLGYVVCMDELFPRAYIRYVKLLRSLAYCLTRLDNMKIFINSIKESRPSASRLPRPDTSTLDHELSKLFSLDIFSDSNPPSVLLDKLISLPETRLSSIGKEMRFSKHPIVEYYFWYSRNLSKFLENKGYTKVLKDLQQAIAEIQPVMVSTPAGRTQSDQK